MLREVYHVAHVPHACRILEDGKMRAGLIGDESRLKQTRTSVTWVSANYWQPGSIYGTVQFTLPWDELIEGKRVYWVEVMDYPNPAYRFLITAHDLSGSKHLTPYDPASDRGPLRFSGGAWYWNDQYTSEFMLDRDIVLDECTKLSFIRHRPDRCRLFGSACQEREHGSAWSAGRVMAFMLGKGIKAANHALLDKTPKTGERRLSVDAALGLDAIWRALAPKKGDGPGPLRKQESATSAVRGALLLYGSGSVADAKVLAQLCHSADVFEEALAGIVRKHFKLRTFRFYD